MLGLESDTVGWWNSEVVRAMAPKHNIRKSIGLREFHLKSPAATLRKRPAMTTILAVEKLGIIDTCDVCSAAMSRGRKAHFLGRVNWRTTSAIVISMWISFTLNMRKASGVSWEAVLSML